MTGKRFELAGMIAGVITCCVLWSVGAAAAVGDGGYTMAELYRAKGFRCPPTEEVYAPASDVLLEKFTGYSDGIENAERTADGALVFDVTASGVVLYWGNARGKQPLAERVYLPADNFDLTVDAVQSGDGQ